MDLNVIRVPLRALNYQDAAATSEDNYKYSGLDQRIKVRINYTRYNLMADMKKNKRKIFWLLPHKRVFFAGRGRGESQ